MHFINGAVIASRKGKDGSSSIMVK